MLEWSNPAARSGCATAASVTAGGVTVAVDEAWPALPQPGPMSPAAE